MTVFLRRIKIEKVLTPMMPLGGWYLRVSPRMITCKQFNEFIFDYTEGLLTDKQLVLFERHMKLCPMCRNFLKTYVASFKAGKTAYANSEEIVPSSIPEDLLAAISEVKDIE